jgi:hypothetical protein
LIRLSKHQKYFFNFIYYSNRLKKSYEANRIKKGRYEEMVNRDFSKYDIIIHEAGIPPIHTPQSTFRDMDASVIYIYIFDFYMINTRIYSIVFD